MRCVGRCRYGTVHDSHLQQVLPTHAKRQPQRRRATPTLYHPSAMAWRKDVTRKGNSIAHQLARPVSSAQRGIANSLFRKHEETKCPSTIGCNSSDTSSHPLTDTTGQTPLMESAVCGHSGLTLVLISVNKTAPSSTRALCKPQVEALGPLWARTILDAEHGARAGDTGIRIYKKSIKSVLTRRSAAGPPTAFYMLSKFSFFVDPLTRRRCCSHSCPSSLAMSRTSARVG